MMDEVKVNIAGEVPLEGLLHLPGDRPPHGGVVVCHPHTVYGGTMQNAVVSAVARNAARRGLAALRFNFRGAGNSGGQYGGGKAETADVAAALAFLAGRIGPELPLALVGYSFGAVVAIAYLAEMIKRKSLPIQALALVGLPVAMGEFSWLDFSPLRENGLPVLVVAGAEDDLGGPAEVQRALSPLGENTVVKVVPGAEHMYVGHRGEVGRLVVDFLVTNLTTIPT
ncbi:MAG: alpha/beta hydrolase [Chloroflexota bacterium]